MTAEGSLRALLSLLHLRSHHPLREDRLLAVRANEGGVHLLPLALLTTHLGLPLLELALALAAHLRPILHAALAAHRPTLLLTLHQAAQSVGMLLQELPHATAHLRMLLYEAAHALARLRILLHELADALPVELLGSPVSGTVILELPATLPGGLIHGRLRVSPLLEALAALRLHQATQGLRMLLQKLAQAAARLRVLLLQFQQTLARLGVVLHELAQTLAIDLRALGVRALALAAPVRLVVARAALPLTLPAHGAIRLRSALAERSIGLLLQVAQQLLLGLGVLVEELLQAFDVETGPGIVAGPSPFALSQGSIRRQLPGPGGFVGRGRFLGERSARGEGEQRGAGSGQNHPCTCDHGRYLRFMSRGSQADLGSGVLGGRGVVRDARRQAPHPSGVRWLYDAAKPGIPAGEQITSFGGGRLD
ncbi:MAG: hypothetical protein ACF8NJ_02530 [Phycisphaerales bacterium JB038]